MITQAQIDRKRERDRLKLLQLTPADFQRTATLKDDDLETVATIDTIRGFRSAGGLFDIQGSDVSLRAHIDKQTKKVTYQVYDKLWYKETQPRDYLTVNYETGGEVGTAELIRISQQTISCDTDSAVLGCLRSEDVAFDVPEEIVRSVAARAADKMWRMKFRGPGWQ